MKFYITSSIGLCVYAASARSGTMSIWLGIQTDTTELNRLC